MLARPESRASANLRAPAQPLSVSPVGRDHVLKPSEKTSMLTGSQPCSVRLGKFLLIEHAGPQGFGPPGELPMRTMLLAGFVAFAAIAASAIGPASAQTTGGIVITHGGGNVNVAKGPLSQADQSATTLGGIASGHGRAITNGGNSRNIASGPLSYAGQDTTTIGGTAVGRGRVITNGGYNNNMAKGFGSSATQSNLTVGGSAFGNGRSITNGGVNTNLAAGKFSSADQQVVTLGGAAGRHGLNVTSGGANTNKALGFGSSASQQVFTGAQ
jgi:hypothetical protein